MNVAAQQRVYVVTHSPVPGKVRELIATLAAPDQNSQKQAGHVMLRHADSAPWDVLSIDRYNSWQDLGADRAASPSGGKGWLDVREYSRQHQDSIAELTGDIRDGKLR